MDILQNLGVALGLATLSGIDLYLTVLITGLAIRFDWVHLADRYQSLDVLGHPAVITVAGILYLVEFLADKVPWVDSLWDSVHTVIRPVGGILLSVEALGNMPPYAKVVAALLAGGAALTTHGAKAGTRLIINHSPEPFTNISMSLAEDVGVVGGMALVIFKPLVALVVFPVFLALLWLIFPRLWRNIRTTLWLAWRKLRMPGGRIRLEEPLDLSKDLNHELRKLLATHTSLKDKDVKWIVRCLSGKCRGVRGMVTNLQGLLIANNQGSILHFAASKGLRNRLFEIPLVGATTTVESRFLSENLLIDARGLRIVFRFPRGQGDLAETVALRVRELIGGLSNPVIKPEDEPVVAPGAAQGWGTHPQLGLRPATDSISSPVPAAG